MQQSFIEKLNNANFGNRGKYLAIGTVIAIVVIKAFVTPFLEPNFNTTSWKLFRAIVEVVENLCMLNIFAFFICIIFFREKIGNKLLYAMQLKDTRYFKEKWVLWWMQSLWICFVIVGFTTIIKQALFKSWMSFFYLLLLISIPFFIMPRLKNRRM